MDIGNRFSLEDFLAYFFPGVTGALGIYALLQLTSISANLPPLTADIPTGIIFFVLSYIVGVIFSSFAELAFSKIKSYKETIPPNSELQKIVLDAYREAFRLPKNAKVAWSKDHFYLCRVIVYERVPGIIPFLQRQSGLRQLRINLLPAFFVWCIVGVAWGIQRLETNPFVEGALAIIVSIMAFGLITAVTIDRARSNEWREVREVLTAFGASYRKTPENDKTGAHKA